MNASTALRLGRVSNLPTVWSNTLAGAVLAGAATLDARLALPMLAMSLAYIGGMFLNDAFDHDIDREQRPERPIPSGAASVASVYIAGFALLASAVLLSALSAALYETSVLRATLVSMALVGTIVLYDAWHKSNPLSPLIMGLCRMLVYLSVSVIITSTPDAAVYTGALVLLGWLVGLTYAARQEHLGEIRQAWPLLPLLLPLLLGVVIAPGTPLVWLPAMVLAAVMAYALVHLRRRAAGDIGRAVTAMIAGIACVDAVLIAVYGGSAVLVIAALAAFALTLALQRVISGT